MTKQTATFCDNRFNLFDPEIEIYINAYLENIEMCAFYLNGDDKKILRSMVEDVLDTTIEEYDPEKSYWDNFDNLIEIVSTYNYEIESSGLTEAMIRIVVDEEKTMSSDKTKKYKIFKIMVN